MRQSGAQHAACVWLACIAVVLTACGPGVQDPADIPPPEIRANGVAGTVVSYCRGGNYCADGAIDLRADNPTIRLPVTLTFAEPIDYITAHVSAIGQDDKPVTLIGATAEGVAMEDTIRIQGWPDGEWDWLTVSAGFTEEVSVSAAWELEGG
jgi:hypothetical protein